MVLSFSLLIVPLLHAFHDRFSLFDARAMSRVSGVPLRFVRSCEEEVTQANEKENEVGKKEYSAPRQFIILFINKRAPDVSGQLKKKRN